MPENKNEKTVDIDTSGPGAEVELDVKQPESNEIEVSNEKDNVKSIDTSAQSNEQPDVQTSKQETENKDQGTEIASEDTDNKKELEDYSEGVKKRIGDIALRGQGRALLSFFKKALPCPLSAMSPIIFYSSSFCLFSFLTYLLSSYRLFLTYHLF